jgi:transcriptional regulator with XRE-family HTH domain
MPTTTDPTRLRAARERAGLRRETVAEALGISYNAVMAYERGASDPSARVLVGLARLYQTTVEDLCHEAPAGAA